MENMTKKTTGKEGEGKDAFAQSANGSKADMSSLTEELQRQEGLLTGLHAGRDPLKVVLDVMAEQVANRQTDWLAIQGGAGSKKEMQLDLIGDEMERVAAGRLSVPRYNPELKTQQEIFLFSGTHWLKLGNEYFFQWVKVCCRRMGVPKAKVNSTSFMTEAFHAVAYRFSNCWEKVPPPEGEALLNLQNGTLEVSRDGTMHLRGHRQEDYFVNCLPFRYDEQATCCLWDTFLARVLPDSGCQRMLQEYVANALVGGAVKLDVMLILKGSGANGKSVLLEVLGALVGKENVSNISLNDLTSEVVMRKGFEHKLLNLSSESGPKWDATVLKQLTSHEPVTVKELYHNSYEMTEYGYMIAAVNEMPRAETTDAFYRRLRVLPFNATISPDEADPELATKLKAELPGILNWFLAGLPALMKRKRLSACKKSEEEVENYRGATDYVYWFLSECCKKSEKWQTGKVIFDHFKYFCENNCIPFTMTPHRFYERLKNLRVKHSMKNHQISFQLMIR